METGEIIFLVKESDEGGYEAAALGHAIFTEAESWEELRIQVKDAVLCHFDDEVTTNVKLQLSPFQIIQ